MKNLESLWYLMQKKIFVKETQEMYLKSKTKQTKWS